MILNVNACQPATLLPIHVPGDGKLVLWGGRCGGHREHITSDLGEVGADLLGLLPDLRGVDRWVRRRFAFLRVDGRPDTLARPNGKTTTDVALAFKSLLREEQRKGATGGLLYRKISCMPKIACADVVATFRLRAGHRPVRCP